MTPQTDPAMSPLSRVVAGHSSLSAGDVSLWCLFESSVTEIVFLPRPRNRWELQANNLCGGEGWGRGRRVRSPTNQRLTRDRRSVVSSFANGLHWQLRYADREADRFLMRERLVRIVCCVLALVCAASSVSAESVPLPRSTPESQGVSSAQIPQVH